MNITCCNFLVVALLFPTTVSAADRLVAVKEYQQLRCGVLENVPEMSEPVSGKYAGYDVEFCTDMASALNVKVEVVPLSENDQFTALLRDQRIDVLVGHTAVDKLGSLPITPSIPYFSFGGDDVRVMVSPSDDVKLAKFIDKFIWEEIKSGRQAKLHNDYTGEAPPNLKDRTCGYASCPWLEQ